MSSTPFAAASRRSSRSHLEEESAVVQVLVEVRFAMKMPFTSGIL
jgi:hypothetical protein